MHKKIMLALKGNYFITGTDTDVGKTVASVYLLDALKKQGYSTLGLKPVASGCINGKNADALTLMTASTIKLPYEWVNPYAYTEPVAPHILANKIKKPLSVSCIAKKVTRTFAKKADVCLIEGAGGWMVPLNDKEYWRELIHCLDIPVILVVGMKVGCINHAILTARAIKDDSCVLAGWIANQLDKNMCYWDENIHAISTTIGVPLLATVPYQE